MTAAIAALLALAVLVAKSTDLVRNGTDKGEKAPKWVWNVVPIVIGVGYCLGWQVEVVSAFAAKIPALAPHASSFAGVSGRALSGFLAGGLAGPAHELMDYISGAAKVQHATADAVGPTESIVTPPDGP